MEPSQYDHRRVATMADPEQVHARMRSQCPVAHSETYGGFWALTRYADVNAATRDTDTFASSPTVTLPAVGAPRPFIPIELDPPDHQKYRNLLNAVFGARRIAGFEQRIRDYVVSRIEEFRSAGEADLATDLVFPLTARVITWFLGLPDEDVPQFAKWSIALVTVGSPEEEIALQLEIRDYYMRLIEQRIDDPRDDLASQLLGSTIDGRPVRPDEVLDIYLTLTGAGGETTAASGNHIFTLLDTRRDLRKQLQEDPGLIPAAVEEFLRYVTPVYGFGRTVTRDVELQGNRVTAGERVWLSWLSANHDPDHFDRPEELVLDRKPNPHLAFGAGVHRCPGAPLARLQLCIVLEEVLTRLPDYTVTDWSRAVVQEGITRVIKSVPIAFTPRANRADQGME